MSTDPAFACTISPGFLQWLQETGSSVVFTANQTGQVLLVGCRDGRGSLLSRTFLKPMGIDVDGDRLALATKYEVLSFTNSADLASEYPEPGSCRYDALYLPRVAYQTGNLNTHDIAFGDEGLWLVNTRYSCLFMLSHDYSFVPRWAPPFISELTPDDRCHLNGMAMRDGRPQTVSAFAMADTREAWRDDRMETGILINVPDGEVVASGFCMPHSPRWHHDRLWVLNSGHGALCQVDTETGRTETVCRLPGYLRGMCFSGNHALIGSSRIRREPLFSGVPVAGQGAPLRCGIWLIDLKSGAEAGFLELGDGVDEVFDVRVIEGKALPNLLGFGHDASLKAHTTPEFSCWLAEEEP